MLSIFRSAATLGTSIAFLSACAVQTPPAIAETLSPEDARADLERLYTGLRAAEADLFAVTPAEVFERRYQELHDQMVEPVTPDDLHADLQRFAALAQHAHTRIEGLNPAWNAYSEGGGTVFPLDFLVDNGEVIVAGAPTDSAVQPGDRLLSLNGDPNPIWLPKLTRNISAETPELAYALMANGAAYFVWLEYGPKDSFDLEIERDGATKTVTMPSIPLEELSELERLEDGFVLQGREAKLLTETVGYLRPGGFFNLKATTPEAYFDPDAIAAYQAFIDEAFTSFISQGVEHLVLDLRDNPGGDNSFSDPVIAWFADEPFRFASDFRIRVSAETTASNQARLDAMPEGTKTVSQTFADLFAQAELGDVVSFDLPYAQPRDGARFTGDVHVLVNRYSYSNAVSVAALIQDYGFGTIYGEPTRDMATTYGAMEHFVLPHSGFRIGYPKAHIIRPNGAEHSHPVTPDVALPRQAIRGERDVMLDALLDKLTHEAE